MLHLILSATLVLAFFGMLAFTVMACFHVDDAKRAEFRAGFTTFGPFVPERLLTPTGMRFAMARNVCAVWFAGGGLLYAIFLRLNQA